MTSEKYPVIVSQMERACVLLNMRRVGIFAGREVGQFSILEISLLWFLSILPNWIAVPLKQTSP